MRGVGAAVLISKTGVRTDGVERLIDVENQGNLYIVVYCKRGKLTGCRYVHPILSCMYNVQHGEEECEFRPNGGQWLEM